MKTCAALVLAAIGGMAASANAQVTASDSQPVKVVYSLSWTKAAGGNMAEPNKLFPGESANLSLTVSLSHAINTSLTYPGELGGTGSGTLRGIMMAFFDLVGTNNAAGTWSNLAIDEDWDLTGGYGIVSNGGARLESIQAGQFPATQSGVNTANPIVGIWTGTWKPDSYADRTVNFATTFASAGHAGNQSAIIVRSTPTTLVISPLVDSVQGSTNIQIVPGPSSLALLGLGGLAAVRRRR